MGRFTLDIRTDNAAFEPHPLGEVARILDNLSATLSDDDSGSGPLLDANGNRVGSWLYTEEQ